MDFSQALMMIKDGYRMKRRAWNSLDPGSYVYLKPSEESSHEILRRPSLEVYLSDGTVMPWSPTQLDLFAEDWFLATWETP